MMREGENPPSGPLDSGRLFTFLAVVREQGFSRAARALGKTQSSVSQAVALLEKELGAVLLSRQGRTVALTDAGRLFRLHAERVLEQMEQARAALQAGRELRAGEIVVGASDTLACYLLPPVLAAYRRRFPGVNVRLENRPSPATAEGVARRRLHVGVVSLPLPAVTTASDAAGVPERARTRVERLCAQTDVLILPPGHALGRMRRVTLPALVRAGDPLLLLDRTTGSRAFIEQALGPLPRRPVVAMEMSSVEVLKRLCELGFGLSVVPAWAVEQEVATRRLLARPLLGLPRGRSVGLVLPALDPLPPVTAAFAEIARQVLGGRR